MQLKFGTCQLRLNALQRKAVALLCRTEDLQREPSASQCELQARQRKPDEDLQCKPGHGLLPQRVCCYEILK